MPATVSFGAFELVAWHVMQALPGCMLAEPRSPFVQKVLLVHTVAVPPASEVPGLFPAAPPAPAAPPPPSAPLPPLPLAPPEPPDPPSPAAPLPPSESTDPL